MTRKNPPFPLSKGDLCTFGFTAFRSLAVLHPDYITQFQQQITISANPPFPYGLSKGVTGFVKFQTAFLNKMKIFGNFMIF